MQLPRSVVQGRFYCDLEKTHFTSLTSLFFYWVLIVLLLSKTPILSQTTSLPSSSPLFYYLHILWYPTLCNYPSLLVIYNCLMGLSNNFIRIFGPSLFDPRKRFLFSFRLQNFNLVFSFTVVCFERCVEMVKSILFPITISSTNL